MRAFFAAGVERPRPWPRRTGPAAWSPVWRRRRRRCRSRCGRLAAGFQVREHVALGQLSLGAGRGDGRRVQVVVADQFLDGRAKACRSCRCAAGRRARPALGGRRRCRGRGRRCRAPRSRAVAPSSITQRAAPTSTSAPSSTAIDETAPPTGAGTSIVTLSVSSSTSGSSAATASPTFLNHFDTVARRPIRPVSGRLHPLPCYCCSIRRRSRGISIVRPCAPATPPRLPRTALGGAAADFGAFFAGALRLRGAGQGQCFVDQLFLFLDMPAVAAGCRRRRLRTAHIGGPFAVGRPAPCLFDAPVDERPAPMFSGSSWHQMTSALGNRLSSRPVPCAGTDKAVQTQDVDVLDAAFVALSSRSNRPCPNTAPRGGFRCPEPAFPNWALSHNSRWNDVPCAKSSSFDTHLRCLRSDFGVI